MPVELWPPSTHWILREHTLYGVRFQFTSVTTYLVSLRTLRPEHNLYGLLCGLIHVEHYLRRFGMVGSMPALVKNQRKIFKRKYKILRSTTYEKVKPSIVQRAKTPLSSLLVLYVLACGRDYPSPSLHS
uniref:Uncharacterized protein n=1 Tax=Glossina pallidipes TaxID=7398 RepID=A0A1A9ZTC7_GLOPL